jgi:hypothetical protein
MPGQQDRRQRSPYCGSRCRQWHRAFIAFSEGGASIGRDAETDSATFAALRQSGLCDPRVVPVLRELFDAYGRR